MSPPAGAADAGRVAEEVARSAYARLVAVVAARTRDVAAAEDALSDAFVAALRHWPVTGVPTSPEGWLVTAARRRLLEGVRHADVAARAAPALARLAEELAASTGAGHGPVGDGRLELLFVCTHPALDAGIRAPLMLQVVLGVPVARIASAFLVSPAAMSRRLVRVKAKIRDAGIPFAVPAAAELPGRLGSVLEGVYAAYGTAWDDSAATVTGLGAEALRLARLVVELLPAEPEAHGLLALLLHCEARRPARRAPDGSFVPLAVQDVARWSPGLIAEAERHLAVAAAAGRPGRFQLEAAIQSVHALRAVTGRIDWVAISTLYDGLVALAPTVGALVARAAARAEVHGPAEGLARLDAVPGAAGGVLAVRGAAGGPAYQPWWVVRAHLLDRLGRTAEAAEARWHAVGLTTDPAVRAHLTRQHVVQPRGAPDA